MRAKARASKCAPAREAAPWLKSASGRYLASVSVDPYAPDPALDRFRVAPDGLCWWCRAAPATTGEHKIKATDLRRLAGMSGPPAPSNLYRGGDSYSGLLSSLKRGSSVQWAKVMCAKCNGSRDLAFDRAYGVFSDYVWTQHPQVRRSRVIRWRSVYERNYQPHARNVARYFGKQIGCMLASQNLPVPEEVRSFMDGAAECPDVRFSLSCSSSHMLTYDQMASAGATGIGYFLPTTQAYFASDGQSFGGADYVFILGFVTVAVEWRIGGGQPRQFFHRPTQRLAIH